MQSVTSKTSSGFTIVEVMIVLAVMSALVASALVVFRQRVPRTQFANAVNELQQRIIDSVSQVTNGYYPAASGLTCTLSGTGEPIVSTSSSSDTTGRQQDCVYIGQVLQFGPQNGNCTLTNPSRDDCTSLIFYTLFGRRSIPPANSSVKSLMEAKPRISQNFAQTPYKLGYGMHVTEIFYRNSGNANKINTTGFVVLQSFGNEVGRGIGASEVYVRPLDSSLSLGQTPADFVAAINLENKYAAKADNRGITVCLRSGTSGQFATMTIGSNGSTAISDRVIYDNKNDWQNKGGCNE